MPSIFDSAMDLGTSDGQKMYTMCLQANWMSSSRQTALASSLFAAFKDRVCTCIWVNHLLIRNDTADENDIDLYEDIIDRPAFISLKQVRTARELCQTGGDK
jgi:hypothetical protein